MAINRVDLADETLIDISDSTVNANNLMNGEVAYMANGDRVVGSVVTAEVVDNLTSTSAEDALSANQGRVLNGKVEYVYDSGFASRNLLVGVEVGSYSADTGNPIAESNLRRSKNIIKVESGKDYVFSINGVATNCVKQLYDSNKKYLRQTTTVETVWNCPNDVGYITFRSFAGDVSKWDSATQLMFEQGSSATSYTPYAESNTQLTEELSTCYSTSDSSSTSIADTDCIPLCDTDGNKKKSVWTTLRDKFWTYVSSQLASVATSGSYNDLSDKPTIPDVRSVETENLTDATVWYSAVPNVAKNNSICVIQFSYQLKSGTYYGYGKSNQVSLGTLPWKPTVATRFMAMMGGSTAVMMVCGANGNLYFNDNRTLSSNTVMAGQGVYITNEE